MVRIAALSDIHGNLPALAAVHRAVDAARPDYVAICGDLVFNGPDPAGSLALVQELQKAGAFVTLGNTDMAVADGDFTAAFPWFTDGPPDSYLAAVEWTRDQIGDDGVDYLRRLDIETISGDTVVQVNEAGEYLHAKTHNGSDITTQLILVDQGGEALVELILEEVGDLRRVTLGEHAGLAEVQQCAGRAPKPTVRFIARPC